MTFSMIVRKSLIDLVSKQRSCSNVFQIRNVSVNRSSSSSLDNNDELVVDRLTGKQSGIVVLSFNRPKAANALSRSLVKSFSDNIEQLSTDDQLRVLVIRSLVPRVFCAGADLKERLGLTPREVSRLVVGLRALSTRVQDFPQPTIAAIDGAALGGGLEYALAADIRIASNNAKMGLVESTLGIIPGAGGTQRLPRLIQPNIAKELIFTGRIIDGAQAFEYGLVNHSVPQNDSGDAAYQKSLTIAQEMLRAGPVSLRAAKIAINRGSEVDITSGLAIEATCYEMVVNTQDRVEGLLAFKEKRAPNYTGK